jgi:hypothetical protein
MRSGILADIQESLTNLRWAIHVLREQAADRLVVLGDVFELGHRLKETVIMGLYLWLQRVYRRMT